MQLLYKFMIKAVLMVLGCSFMATELSAAGAKRGRSESSSDDGAGAFAVAEAMAGLAGAPIVAPPARGREFVTRGARRQRVAGPTEAPVAAVPDFDLAAAPAIAVAMELDGDGRVTPAGAPGEPLAVTLAAVIAAHSPERAAVRAGAAAGSPLRVVARALQLVVGGTPPRRVAVEGDIAAELEAVVTGTLPRNLGALNLADLGGALAAAAESVARYSTAHDSEASDSAPAFGSRADTDSSL